MLPLVLSIRIVSPAAAPLLIVMTAPWGSPLGMLSSWIAAIIWPPWLSRPCHASVEGISPSWRVSFKCIASASSGVMSLVMTV